MLRLESKHQRPRSENIKLHYRRIIFCHRNYCWSSVSALNTHLPVTIFSFSFLNRGTQKLRKMGRGAHWGIERERYSCSTDSTPPPAFMKLPSLSTPHWWGWGLNPGEHVTLCATAQLLVCGLKDVYE